MVSGVLLRGMQFDGNIAEHFRSYKQRLKIYLSAIGLDKSEDKRKISILLNYIGKEGIKIYNTFNCKGTETFNEIIEQFKNFFNEESNHLAKRIFSNDTIWHVAGRIFSKGNKS